MNDIALTRYDTMRQAIVEAHSIDDETKRQSRADAKYFRDAVRKRSNGKCEICGFFCHPIMNIHHVKPVSKGGNGYPENLIALCPNCHTTIHRLKDTEKNGDEKGLALIGSWIEIIYPFEQMKLLGSIAFETAEYRDGIWIANNSHLVWEWE